MQKCSPYLKLSIHTKFTSLSYVNKILQHIARTTLFKLGPIFTYVPKGDYPNGVFIPITEQIFFDFNKTLHMQCTVYFK